MFPSGSAFVSLRGWSFASERDLDFFFRNTYSGQVMSKNEINILSRTETRGNTAYIEDLIINDKYIYKMSLVNIRAKEVLFRIFA
jgi:hypothetical protein